jgi:hypothetical protein
MGVSGDRLHPIDPLWRAFILFEPIDGVVTRVEDYGAHVELVGGMEGVLPLEDFSW